MPLIINCVEGTLIKYVFVERRVKVSDKWTLKYSRIQVRTCPSATCRKTNPILTDGGSKVVLKTGD